MKRVLLAAIIMVVVPSTASAAAKKAASTPVKAVSAPAVKINLCHATASKTNPFNLIAVDVNSVVKEGHDQHSPGGNADIIPPFTYADSSGKSVSYAGRSWDAAGQATFNNSCKVPTPVVTPAPTLGSILPPVEITPLTVLIAPATPAPVVATAPRVDLCTNLGGNQWVVPEDTYRIATGECLKVPDLCTNIAKAQPTIPLGMYSPSGGICKPIVVDVCPKLKGNQDVSSGLIETTTLYGISITSCEGNSIMIFDDPIVRVRFSDYTPSDFKIGYGAKTLTLSDGSTVSWTTDTYGYIKTLTVVSGGVSASITTRAALSSGVAAVKTMLDDVRLRELSAKLKGCEGSALLPIACAA